MRNLCLIDNISLVRMHAKEVEHTESADTITADTIIADTITRPIERRLTPEDFRQQNRTGKHINIQTAPSVRTPNSIGPRRKRR